MEKKIWIVVLFVVLGSSTLALGLSPMGPPKAGLDKGQFGVGLSYTYGEMDLEFDSDTEEVDTSMLFVDIGYGIMDQWEGFARLGFAKLEVDDWDGGNKFAYGFGTKVTLTEEEPTSWGGLFQIGWIEGDDSGVEIDAYEIQIAVGPTYEADKMRIYGGPFLHFVDGDVENGGSVDIEQESVFGGYVGAQFDVAENTAAGVELQFTGDAWGIMGRIGWSF
jgi:hypothetical protein